MRKFAMVFVLFTALVAAGCGGGGGSTPGPNGGTGPLGVFVTDAFNDDYDHVWVRLHRVELLDAAGTAETIFDDPTGVEIDLKTLRDASGSRFALLSNAAVQSRTHTQVRVTTGSTFILFPTGAAAGQSTPVADAVARDGSGRPIIVFPLSSPRNLGSGTDDLVIDFDLASFTVVNGKVVPVLREGEKNGLNNPGRQEHRTFNGTVAGLSGTSPDFTFTLNQENGRTFPVVTNAATRIFHSGAATNPQLQNGARVQVRGTFDVSTNRFTATQVKLKNNDDNNQNEAEIKGAPSAINAAAGRFAVAATEVRGFLPTQTTVTVATTGTTVFRSDRGVLISAEQFFAALPTARRVEVEGVYDAATNTLTARKAKLEDDDTNVNEAEARGRPENNRINAAAGTFRINPLDEWEGFVPAGASVSVVTNASTRFRDNAGNEISATVFFANLAASPLVKVEGVYSGGTITASQARLRSSSNGGGGGGNRDDD